MKQFAPGNLSTTTNYMAFKKEVYLTEKEKLRDSYFHDMALFYISTLVDDNLRIQAARNYYSSKRDVLDFEYLEDLYGMQNPIDLGFTNIIKPRVDALVGMSLMTDPVFSIAYTDADTIKAVEEEKMAGIFKELATELNKGINKTIATKQQTPDAQQKPADGQPEDSVKTQLKKIADKFGENYVSSYEVGAQHILNFIETDAEIDMLNVKKELSKDYFITGEAYTREIYKGDGKDPKKVHIEPEYIFHNKPKGDRDLKGTDVVVCRRLVTVHNILKELGDILTKEEAELIFSTYSTLGSERNLMFGAGDANLASRAGMEMDFNGMDAVPLKTGWSDVAGGMANIEAYLYHVEWLASTRIPDGKGGHVYREDRYECYRVGPDVYVGGRRCDEAPRRHDSLWKTTLSYKGLINTNPSGYVESMVNSMREIQDLYDIMMFFRNNTVANSGVSGSRVNVAAIPKALGKEFMPRLLKWVTMRKQGLELIDPTEEGAQLFQHYGDFNAAIRGDSITAINAILESLTVQADIVSGVPRQMLGVIEQRDAVENVKTGINQVSVLSLEMFRDIDRCLNRGMQETLDNYRWAYRNEEKSGVYKHGTAMVPFVVSPSKFSLTDFKVTVISSGIENPKLLKIQQLAKELVTAGAADPDVIIKTINKRSVLEVENLLEIAVAKRKEENQNIQQLQQQVEETTKQLQQATAEIDRLNNNKAQLEKEKLQLEKGKASAEQALRDRELDIIEKKNKEDNKIAKKDIQLKAQTVELEKEQLLFDTGNAKEVNNKLN